MLSMLIEDGDLTIKDIDRKELDKIVEWFNTGSINNEYRYAMGMNKPITIDEMHEKYLEALINIHEFFVSINFKNDFIGFVKGRAEYQDNGKIWFMSLLVDNLHQNKGIGRRVLELMITEFREKFGIKEFFSCIVNDNIRGKAFWKKNDFEEYRSAKDYFTIDNRTYDMVIMRRNMA